MSIHSLSSKGAHKARHLISLVFLLLATLLGPLLTCDAFARDILDVAIGPVQKTSRFKQEFFSATVTGGKAPYQFHWFAYAPDGSIINEYKGKASNLIHDFYCTLPKKSGKYSIKLVVNDANGDYGTGVRSVTVKPSTTGSTAPTTSDLLPIITGKSYVEAGEQFDISWDAQGSGVAPLHWEWLTPRGPRTNKTLRGRLAQAGREMTVTLLVWDAVIPKSAAKKLSHTVHAVAPLTASINSSGARRLGPREFQVQKGKPFTLVATPKGGVGLNYQVKWGSHKGNTYARTINKIGVGNLTLAINDEGRYEKTPKTWSITIRAVDSGEGSGSTLAGSDNLSGWWVYENGKRRVPLIINPRGSGNHYTGAYFPTLSTDYLVKSPDTVVSNLQITQLGNGNTIIYSYKYNDGSDRGTGTMTRGSRDAMTGDWKSEDGSRGFWTWKRPTAAEVKKLRAHFGRG
ncbi:hypothetical protein IAD21_06329 [Abditibacteriota bacterium]|nr:hypothetical protein IAD21_06329 [Abditibacteriota bacterium]